MTAHGLRLGLGFAFISLLAVVGVKAAGERLVAQEESLLAEIQALRADVRKSSAVTVRAHLLSSRLLLQESRVNLLRSQLASIQRSIADSDAQKGPYLASLKRAEDGVAQGLQGFDTAIAQARSALARIDRESQAIRDSEQRLHQQIKVEQERWVGINQLLEELESSAAQPAR